MAAKQLRIKYYLITKFLFNLYVGEDDKKIIHLVTTKICPVKNIKIIIG